MTTLKIELKREGGETVLLAEGEREAAYAWRGEYVSGDSLVVSCSEPLAQLVARLDPCMAESRVLLCGGSYEFPIPFGDKRKMYGADWAFAAERHYGYVRLEDEREAHSWRNLALNSHDFEPCDAAPVSLYPHASTNTCCTNPQFFARNAIDGVCAPLLHGSWPHQSWGINGRDDAWLQIDFGEPVLADELRLYLRADFPHDTYWRRAWAELSDGRALLLDLEKTAGRQTWCLDGRPIEWLRLSRLERDDPEGFPGLSQLEVWGCRCLS